MPDLEPQPNDHVYHRCPFCKADVDYFSLQWHTVTTRQGQLLRRRMGPCNHCGQWVKPVLVLAEDHDNRGWLIEPVDPYEVDQITNGELNGP